MGTPRPQTTFTRFETRMVSNRNGIIIQTSGTTTKHRDRIRCGYFFTTTTILWQYSNVGNLFIMSSGADQSIRIRHRVAPPRVSAESATVMDLQGCVGN